MTTTLRSPPKPRGSAKVPWLTWLLGAAMLGAVVLVALHVSEERAFVRLAARARPLWLLAAVLLQALTYPCQSQVWQTVLRPARVQVSVAETCKLSVARLFVDQALPSAGLSGTVVSVKALERHGVPVPVVMAAVVIDTASLYATYALGLAAALLIAVLQHEARGLIWAAIPLLLFAAALTIGFLSVSGHTLGPLARRAARIPPLGAGLHMLEQADPRLARSPRLLLTASACQLAVVLLDATTMWALIAALGATAPLAGVFASFMISTMLRLVGVVPGGLGVFEGASVLTLRLLGMDVAVALSATLLFRGLSFWLPLVPGLWFSRSYLRATGASSSGRASQKTS